MDQSIFLSIDRLRRGRQDGRLTDQEVCRGRGKTGSDRGWWEQLTELQNQLTAHGTSALDAAALYSQPPAHIHTCTYCTVGLYWLYIAVQPLCYII